MLEGLTRVELLPPLVLFSGQLAKCAPQLAQVAVDLLPPSHLCCHFFRRMVVGALIETGDEELARDFLLLLEFEFDGGHREAQLTIHLADLLRALLGDLPEKLFPLVQKSHEVRIERLLLNLRQLACIQHVNLHRLRYLQVFVDCFLYHIYLVDRLH